MCGIFAILGRRDLTFARKLARRMAHRGPDERGYYQSDLSHILIHERLMIIDLKTGRQPIKGCDDAYVAHNGEIYNHEQLQHEELNDHAWHTTCDSEVIVHLYEKYGIDFCNKLDGVFAFVLLQGDKMMAARDPIGVKPLYFGRSEDGSVWFASEMKSIIDQCDKELIAFPPGHYWTPETGFVRYFNPSWHNYQLCNEELDLTRLRDALTESTKKRLMSDVPLGLLLSGGLDSSLTSSIAQRLIHENDDAQHNLMSFSIGLDETAPDLIAARKVADFLGTDHHEIHFTVEQGLQILDRLVWHLESYDVTTIRASTPMYFLSEYIQERGVKVVLSGEGADEIFGGYLYFHNAPNDDEFQKETIRRVGRLSTADNLRADKSTMAHGIELRVPFLDKDFLQVAMSLAAKYKRPSAEHGNVEKYPLRKAFDDPLNPYLPDEILWRQKEQFSDGVGYNWIDQMMAHCQAQVTDRQMEMADDKFPHNTPTTKEAYYIRQLFEKHFPGEHAAKTVLRWVPKWQMNKDPSGRASQIHMNGSSASLKEENDGSQKALKGKTIENGFSPEEDMNPIENGIQNDSQNGFIIDAEA